MHAWFETVTDLHAQADVVRRRPYGVIEAADGRFVRLRLRPFPKLSTPLDFLLRSDVCHRRVEGNYCRLYYNQPCRHDNFLALKFVFSARAATFADLRAVLEALDEIARIKNTDALLCDAANARISDRLLARWGWTAHKPQRWHRNYIKRFYGKYPAPEQAYELQLASLDH
jgi:hypothetical protein